MAATVKELEKKIADLKEMIVDLNLALVKQSIPKGHCFKAYYPDTAEEMEKEGIIDGCDDCNRCEKLFLEYAKKKLSEEVEKL